MTVGIPVPHTCVQMDLMSQEAVKQKRKKNPLNSKYEIDLISQQALKQKKKKPIELQMLYMVQGTF